MVLPQVDKTIYAKFRRIHLGTGFQIHPNKPYVTRDAYVVYLRLLGMRRLLFDLKSSLFGGSSGHARGSIMVLHQMAMTDVSQ